VFLRTWTELFYYLIQNTIEIILILLLRHFWTTILLILFFTINLRLRSLLKRKTLKQTDKNLTLTIKQLFGLPSHFYLIFMTNLRVSSKILMSNYFSLVWKNLTELLKHKKTFFLTKSKKNVVYKINCKNYNASYMGRTSRKLKTRINEHKNDINKKSGNLSVISEHRLQFEYIIFIILIGWTQKF